MSVPQSFHDAARTVDIAMARNVRKATEIIRQPDHPQHDLMMNLIETALALDPPEVPR